MSGRRKRVISTEEIQFNHKPAKMFWPKKKGVSQHGQTPSIIGICSYCVLDRPVFKRCQTLLHPELTSWWSFLLADGARHKKPHSPTHPKFRWWRGHICGSFIIIIKSEVSAFPTVVINISMVVYLNGLYHHALSVTSHISQDSWVSVSNIMQPKMYADNWVYYGLKVIFLYLYITPFHYHHYADLS